MFHTGRTLFNLEDFHDLFTSSHWSCELGDIMNLFSCRHLCDGKWQCPSGEDERKNLCHSYQCVGLFHCAMEVTRMCVHPSSICNGVYDCPSHADEFLCELPRQCPQGCVCLMYAVKCTSLLKSIPLLSQFFEHVVYCKLIDVEFLSGKQIHFQQSGHFKHLVSFAHLNSSIEFICFPHSGETSSLQHLDYSFNRIHSLQ